MDNAVLVGFGLFPHAVQVVFLLGAVDGDADAEVVAVLGDEALHRFAVIVDAVGGEREAVTVEPVVVQFKHSSFQIITNLIDKLNLQKWLAADEIPHHTFLSELVLTAQHKVNKTLGRLPRHPLLDILPHQVAVFASQLAVLGDNEGDVLNDFFLPGIIARLYFHFVLYSNC